MYRGGYQLAEVIGMVATVCLPARLLACATHEYNPSSIFDSSTLRSAGVVCILSLVVCEEQECRQEVVVSNSETSLSSSMGGSSLVWT